MRKSMHLFMISLAGLAVLSAQAQESSSQRAKANPGIVRNGSSKSEAMRAATDDPSYVIGAEDVLNISVWREPEITRTVPVRPDGRISLPLLNDVQAAGLTPTQLALTVTERLRRYVTDPQVTVIVTEINSQRVYILGEVNRGGAYPLLPGMTLLQVLSSAGGFTPFAKLKRIYLLRTESGKQVKYTVNYKEVIGGHRPEQNIALKAGDTIVVP